MEKKQARLNELLKHEIGNIILRDIGIPEVLITITEVQTSEPLTEANVFVSVLPDNRFDEVFKVLGKEVGSIQYQINRRLKMRPVPKIRFVRDTRARDAAKVEKILEDLKEEGENNGD